MASALRRQVLGGYRELLRTNKLLFGRDQEGVRTGLAEIRSQFRANQHLTDVADIGERLAPSELPARVACQPSPARQSLICHRAGHRRPGAEAKVADIHDAVDFARTGIVQLEHAGGGHYSACARERERGSRPERRRDTRRPAPVGAATKLSQEQADASMAMRDKHDGCCGGEKALEEGGVRKGGHAHGCA